MSAALPPQWLTQFFSDAGAVAAGAKLYSWISGTTTPTPVYADADGVTPLSNPAIADSAGRLEFYLDDQIVYKLEVRNSAGVTLWEIPEVSGAAPADVSAVISQGYRSQNVNSGTTPAILSRTLSTNVDTTQCFKLHVSVPVSTDPVTLAIVDRNISPGPVTLFTETLNAAGDSADLFVQLIVENRLIGASRSCSYGLYIGGTGQNTTKQAAGGLAWRSSSGDVAFVIATASAVDIPVSIWCSTIEERRHD